MGGPGTYGLRGAAEEEEGRRRGGRLSLRGVVGVAAVEGRVEKRDCGRRE